MIISSNFRQLALTFFVFLALILYTKFFQVATVIFNNLYVFINYFFS